MRRGFETDGHIVHPIKVTLGPDEYVVSAQFVTPEASGDPYRTNQTKARNGDRLPEVVDATHELRELGLVRAIAAARKAARPDHPDFIDWDSPLLRIGVAAKAELTLRQVPETPDASGQERVLLKLSRQMVGASLNVQFPRTSNGNLERHETDLGLDLVEGSEGRTGVAISVGTGEPLMATPEQADRLIGLLQASDIPSSPEA